LENTSQTRTCFTLTANEVPSFPAVPLQARSVAFDFSTRTNCQLVFLKVFFAMSWMKTSGKSILLYLCAAPFFDVAPYPYPPQPGGNPTIDCQLATPPSSQLLNEKKFFPVVKFSSSKGPSRPPPSYRLFQFFVPPPV